MEPIQIVIYSMAAVVGGTVAWRYATWNLYRRPGAEWSTDSIHPDRISRRLLARRKRQRRNMTFLAALFTPMMLFAFWTIFEVVIELSHTRS